MQAGCCSSEPGLSLPSQPSSPLPSCKTQESDLQRHFLEDRDHHPQATQAVTLPLGICLLQHVSPVTDKVHLDAPHMLKKEEGKNPTAETCSPALAQQSWRERACMEPAAPLPPPRAPSHLLAPAFVIAAGTAGQGKMIAATQHSNN